MVPQNDCCSATEKTFSRRFFKYMHRTMGVESFHTTAHQLQTNGQVERLNRANLAGIRNHMQDHPKNWNSFTDLFTFGYNTPVHRITWYMLFELVLSWPHPPFPLSRNSVHYPMQPPKEYLLLWKKWLSLLNKDTRENMTEGQEPYKRDAEKWMYPDNVTLTAGNFIFLKIIA